MKSLITEDEKTTILTILERLVWKKKVPLKKEVIVPEPIVKVKTTYSRWNIGDMVYVITRESYWSPKLKYMRITKINVDKDEVTYSLWYDNSLHLYLNSQYFIKDDQIWSTPEEAKSKYCEFIQNLTVSE